MRKQTHPLYHHSTCLKRLLLLLIFPLITVMTAQAQQDSTAQKESKFYVGAEVSSIYYGIRNRETRTGGSFAPGAHLNFGYRLNKYVSFQVGITAGRNRDNDLSGIYYGYNDTIIYHNRSHNHRGFAIPLSLHLTTIHLSKRMSLFGTVSLVPVVGKSEFSGSETFEGETKTTYEAHASGINFYWTAGMGLTYKVNSRLEGYAKVILLYKTIDQWSDRVQHSYPVSIGVNYNLNL